jgi:hypothetical protein
MILQVKPLEVTKKFSYVFVVVILLTAVSISSCRKDFSTTPSFGQLEFSRDTVYLDTVFTNIGSATYNLRVYNRSSNDITIPTIGLERGASSNYRLNVDGIPGKTFENIDILARDSIFIFVETTIDVNTVPDPLYTDRILFDTGMNQQDVDLVTLVQDATFIFPDRDPISLEVETLTLNGEPSTFQGRFLEDSELTFTNEKPYVIYGFAAVPANKTLTIEAGARIHFHEDSGLMVDSGGTLKVNGTLNEKVVFEGDRLENVFSTISGQWAAIWLRSGSVENEIHHAQIKNGLIGLIVDDATSSTIPTLHIQNTEVFNHSIHGILGRATYITGENLVVGSAGQASFAGTIGGSYEFTHSTFANHRFGHELPSVLINNFIRFTNDMGVQETQTNDLIRANFTNCIIDGSNNVEFFPDRVEGSDFNFKLTNTMIRFQDIEGTFSDLPEVDFDNTTLYENVILNGFPDFRDRSANDLIIGQNSDAINQGNQAAATLVPLDILGVMRTMSPDLGAYQHIIFD